MPTDVRAEPTSVGLIGFGLAGAVFHAPLIRSVPRLSLVKVSTRRQAEAAAAAGLDVVPDADAIIANPSIDLVVIASPNHTHGALAEAALRAGKHVVVDKPFASSVEEADRLIALAAEQDRVLTVFHNRRWDGDFLTVKALLDEGGLGEVMLFEAFWDRYRPRVDLHWKESADTGGGLLNDLGPHMIDQALCLFGLPEALSADIGIQREGSSVDDYFDLRFDYGQRRVRLAASNLATRPRPRFQLFGRQGSFVKYGMDPQQGHLRDGLVPGAPGYGVEDAALFGAFTGTGNAAEPVPTREGRWGQFYETVADAIDGNSPPPVDPRDARTGLALIELARRSAMEGRRIGLPADL